MDAFLECHDHCSDNRILASKDVEAEPRGRWNAIIVLVSDDLEQLCRAIAALRGELKFPVPWRKFSDTRLEIPCSVA